MVCWAAAQQAQHHHALAGRRSPAVRTSDQTSIMGVNVIMSSSRYSSSSRKGLPAPGMHTRSRHAHMHSHSAFRCAPSAAPVPAATHPSCDAYMQPQVQALVQLLPIACEAVQHARHTAAPEAGRPQDLCKLCACIPVTGVSCVQDACTREAGEQTHVLNTCWHVHTGGDACVLDRDATNMLSTPRQQPDTKQPAAPAVHEQGLAQLQGQRHLRSKPLLLHIWRTEVAVEVEAAFTCRWLNVLAATTVRRQGTAPWQQLQEAQQQ